MSCEIYVFENESAGDKVCFYTVDTNGRPMSAPTAGIYLSVRMDAHSRRILFLYDKTHELIDYIARTATIIICTYPANGSMVLLHQSIGMV